MYFAGEMGMAGEAWFDPEEHARREEARREEREAERIHRLGAGSIYSPPQQEMDHALSSGGAELSCHCSHLVHRLRPRRVQSGR